MPRINGIVLALGLAGCVVTLAQPPSVPLGPSGPRVRGIGLNPFPVPMPIFLRNPAVREELNLTAAQVERQAAIMQQYSEKALQMFRDQRERGQQQSRAALDAAREKAEAEILETLEPGQRDRLDQILLQADGPLAFLRPEFTRRLEMADDQVKQVRPIVEAGQREMMEAAIVPLGLKPGEPASPEAVSKLVESREFHAAEEKSRQATLGVRDALTQRITQVLTERQRLAYRDMLGKPIELAKLWAADRQPTIVGMPGLFGQRADPDFRTKVDRPAYTEMHPRVLFDEAHHNFHTASGRYKPFADLIASDGYAVSPNRESFTKDVLGGYDILVIANALGAEPMNHPDAARPAFTDAECDAVKDWVDAGGSLLLITDHHPMGAAAEALAARFGVAMGKGSTIDPMNSDQGDSRLLFTRANKLLADHPITTGRDESERVNRVVTFAGQSLKGPEGSVAFLKLGDTAVDVMIPGNNRVPAGGRAQGVAFTHGKGRVVVMGEAAQLSAQIAGPQRTPMGMNVPGIDNRQMALNIMHWLSGLTTSQ